MKYITTMTNRRISLGFSPCPNDTFIFDQMVNASVGDTEFEVYMEDVQTLNEWALNGKLDVTKISFGVWPLLKDNYVLLNAGSALGRGVGPLLIAPPHRAERFSDHSPVAIPGKNTTAHLLFSLAYPEAKNKIFLRYDEIEPFVLAGEGLGVIIHENRFTYADKGLRKIVDLGDFWESSTGAPIPLGGIVAKKELGMELISLIDERIRKSIEYSFSRYPLLSDFIRCHAQEMDEEVMRKHIDLYVNEYSLSLGEAGMKAVKILEDVFNRLNEKG